MRRLTLLAAVAAVAGAHDAAAALAVDFQNIDGGGAAAADGLFSTRCVP